MRTGGWPACWFWGICWVGSGPIAIRGGCTVIDRGVIVTLTRVGGCGRGSLALFLGAAAGSEERPARRGRSPQQVCLSHDPSGRNLAEGQVDYPSRNAIFTYGELGAGLGLAAHDRQRDRPEGGGDAGAADRPDLLLAQPQGGAGGRRRAQPQAAQVRLGLPR